MAFLIKSNWDLLNKEVWAPLEKSVSAPSDMYIELMRFYYNILGEDLTHKAEILNDNELAKQEFKNIPPPQSEQTCIKLLEGFYEVLSRFYKGDIAQKYQDKLSEFFQRYNLRYNAVQNCKIRLSIQGLLDSLLLRLSEVASAEENLAESLKDLEDSIADIMNSGGEKNCIKNAYNLLEGVTIRKSNSNEDTLGRALRRCTTLFPHQSLYESVKNINEFWNDYPNLRHAGRSSSRIRNLKKDDAMLIVALSVGFASFISADDDGQKIISGDF